MLTKLKKNQIKRQFTLDDGTENKEIIIIPCKLSPSGRWTAKEGYQVTKTEGELYVTDIEEDRDVPFDDFVNAFTVMNCNFAVGNYLAYYLKN